jgi:hypothetical protein
MYSIFRLLVIATAVVIAGAIPAEAGNRGSATPVRFATFNASLNRFNVGDLAAELAAPGSAQPDVIAEIIQRVRPDVLLINEFDFDSDGLAAQRFQDNYLAVPHGDAEPIVYPYRFVAPSNTGIFSGFDLDNSGAAGDFVPNDSFGFGFFPGQFGMVVYSMFPIDQDRAHLPAVPLERHAGGTLAGRSFHGAVVVLERGAECLSAVLEEPLGCPGSDSQGRRWQR